MIGFFSFYMVAPIVVLQDNPFLLQDIQGQAHQQPLLELQDDSLYIFKYIIMPFSFLMGDLVNDMATMIVNHDLILYRSMSFLFA